MYYNVLLILKSGLLIVKQIRELCNNMIKGKLDTSPIRQQTFGFKSKHQQLSVFLTTKREHTYQYLNGQVQFPPSTYFKTGLIILFSNVVCTTLSVSVDE